MSLTKQTATYKIYVRCHNCSFGNVVYSEQIQIPKGKQVAHHLCPQCGCKTLRAASHG